MGAIPRITSWEKLMGKGGAVRVRAGGRKRRRPFATTPKQKKEGGTMGGGRLGGSKTCIIPPSDPSSGAGNLGYDSTHTFG